ncbi:PTS sugar transporter subunit IIA [Holdemanella porci]|uniref:PTS sugar transporter subunit IIA n=1 Tax=Holdemanella porci TaxID=2652276 RepID=UPI0022E0FE49|nr:PTS glucose transporter subunit IIA [Holdemanella porci]
MGLFDKLFGKKETVELPEIADDAIITLGNGELIDVTTVSDAMFAEQVMGKTAAFKLTDKTVVSPANGTVEVAFETGHAFAVRMKDGTGILVHIGIDTVSLNGKGFKMLAKVGQEVKAGQPMVEVNWNTVNNAGLDASTMLIITEPVEGKDYNFIDPQTVSDYQQINK